MDEQSKESPSSIDVSGAGDSYTETTHVGFLEKLMGSVMGVGIGLLLIVGSSVGMFWNEGRAVTTARSLSEGARLVISADTSRVAPENEGKLVHAVGPLATVAPLSDPVFQVSGKAAVLVRHVEMMQWKEDSRTETRKNVGGSEERVTTYTYRKAWSSTRVDSSRFKQAANHQNPEMRYRDTTVVAKDATLGAFRPGEAALQRLAAGQPLRVEASQADAIQKQITGARVQIVDGAIYIGNDPANPAIGDYRVTYKIAPPGTVTFVARQSGSDFAAYQTKAGDALLFARSGSVPAADVFASAQAENKALTWIIRLVAALVMLIGFALLTGPLVALGDVVPFIGSLIGGIGLFFAAVMTLILAPTVIAIAWLWHRPLLSISVLAGGFVLAWLTRRIAPVRQPTARPAGQSAPRFLPSRPAR